MQKLEMGLLLGLIGEGKGEEREGDGAQGSLGRGGRSCGRSVLPLNGICSELHPPPHTTRTTQQVACTAHMSNTQRGCM